MFFVSDLKLNLTKGGLFELLTVNESELRLCLSREVCHVNLS